MSGPRTSRTWVIISREMVGSTASPMRRTNRWGRTGYLGEVLVKSAPSFSPSYSPPLQTRTTLSWMGNVALVCSSPCFPSLFVFVLSLIHFFILTFLHFVVLGASIIACRSIQCHIVALELDIDIFKSILLPMRELEQEHTSQQVAPQRGSIFAPPPRKMAKRNFDLLCA